MGYQILVINPGATSTKVAWFEDDHKAFAENLRHSDEELKSAGRVADQKPLRTRCVVTFLAARGKRVSELSAIAARGGVLSSVPSGTFEVNQAMVDELSEARRAEHASNLAALIAFELGRPAGIKAYVTDPVSVDELTDVARISGFPPIQCESVSHALNIRAAARRYAAAAGRPLRALDLVVCHLGTGVSAAALQQGRAIDVINPRDEGPFAMDRAGALPIGPLMDHMAETRTDPRQLKQVLFGQAGMSAYLGTMDLLEVERRIAAGDQRADLLHDALAYQTSKAIAEMCVVLEGRAEAIVLTGGMAKSARLVERITRRVGFLAPVHLYPGEFEMEALALGALRVLTGEEKCLAYPARVRAD